MTYRVKEVFATIQGEGVHAGRAALFVRFVGCNMWSGYEMDRQRDAKRNGAACPLWCDTDFTKEGASRFDSARILAAHIANSVTGSDMVIVFTGGEPLLQLDTDLIRAVQAHGLRVHVETNGTVALEGRATPDWITVSPKLGPDRLCIERADEIKLVVPDYKPALFEAWADHRRIEHRWVQPEDGPRFDDACREAVALVQRNPRWRVSVQGHKVVGAP